MKKNYVAPQFVTLEVAIESEVFAGSPPITGTQGNGFFTPVGTTTPSTGNSGASSIVTSRGASSLSGEQSENEIYDDLVSFD